jgi:hypothetical protein
MLTFQASIYGAAGNEAGPLAVSFEGAIAALELLPRLFIEPDGSFVWTGTSADGQPWQIDGNLIDRGDVLAYVEAKGRCQPEQFELLLAALGWPQTPLIFQLQRRGVLLDEREFRRQAATSEGAI